MNNEAELDYVHVDLAAYKLELPHRTANPSPSEAQENLDWILENWPKFPEVTRSYLKKTWDRRGFVVDRDPPKTSIQSPADLEAASAQRPARRQAKADDECRRCGKLGHWAVTCTTPKGDIQKQKNRGARGSHSGRRFGHVAREAYAAAVFFSTLKKEDRKDD